MVKFPNLVEKSEGVTITPLALFIIMLDCATSASIMPVQTSC